MVSERSEEDVPPTPPAPSTLHQAREMLPRLVKAAGEGRPMPLTRKSEGREYRALLASPQAAEEAGWDLAAAASWPTAQARGKLGELIQYAATGSPQVLRRHSTPVAVLIPDPHAPAKAPATDLPPTPHPATPAVTHQQPHEATAKLPATATPAAAGPIPATAPRRLAPLSDALTALPTLTTAMENPDIEVAPVMPGLPTGIAVLDQALGGLQPGRFYLVAGAPGAGASLIATTAARATALTGSLPVLYAASGLTSSDIAARMIAAHTPVDYRRLRAGNLTVGEREAVADTTQLLASAPLFIDDGADLDAAAIVSTAPDVDGLALLVVDRLQTVHDPHLPLSGLTAITDAVQTLAHLARTRHLPVLAVLDTDAPCTVATLDTDITLTLTRTSEQAHLAIAERDFGTLATLHLHTDLPHARITDTSTSPAPIQAATPQPTLPAKPAIDPPDHSSHSSTTAPAQTPSRKTPTKPPARQRVSPAKAAPVTFVSDRVARALAEHDGDTEAALGALAGDGGSAIPDVMELFEATRVETSYEHTTYPKLPEPLIRKRQDQSDDVWEARPKFTHPAVPGGAEITHLDVNAAYLAAMQSAHLPVRTVTHNPDGFEDLSHYGKGIDYAGICLIDPVEWGHPDLPHPLGDDRETSGPLWVPTSTVLGVRDLASPSYGELCALPVIREAYVAKGSAALFKGLVQVLNTARMQAIEDADTLTKAYVAAMYAKLISTMGDSRKNHELKRPDWQHIIRGQAFANLRRKAVRAHQAGLGVVHVGGVDELHVTGDVWAAMRNGKPLFTQGFALNQIKVKRISRKGQR